MTEFGLIKLSLVEAVKAACRGCRVYLLDLDIVETDRCRTVLFFEIVPEENNDR